MVLRFLWHLIGYTAGRFRLIAFVLLIKRTVDVYQSYYFQINTKLSSVRFRHTPLTQKLECHSPRVLRSLRHLTRKSSNRHRYYCIWFNPYSNCSNSNSQFFLNSFRCSRTKPSFYDPSLHMFLSHGRLSLNCATWPAFLWSGMRTLRTFGNNQMNTPICTTFFYHLPNSDTTNLEA